MVITAVRLKKYEFSSNFRAQTMPARRYVEKNGSDAMLAAKRSEIRAESQGTCNKYASA